MEKLSVIVITCNEEAAIQGCLESVSWADEIVVVDSGSRDRTREICHRYTGKVFEEEWRGYGPQKNRCLERASYDWVFSLDADERVTPQLAQELKQVLGTTHPYAGFRVCRRNFFGQRWIRSCGWYPDYSIRLFHRGKGRFNERLVHESVVLQGKVGTLQHPLDHLSYHDAKDFICRQNRYSTLAAQELIREKRAITIGQIIARPLFTFLKSYLLKGGFRDGHYGLLISAGSAFYVLAKYLKGWEYLERQRHDGAVGGRAAP